MTIEKIFCFTKELERNLETLLKMDKLTEDKKIQVRNNLELVSNFNQMEFLGKHPEFKH